MKKVLILLLCIAQLLSFSVFAVAIDVDTDIRGVWLATVSNVDFPSRQGLSESELKKELDTVIDTLKKEKINTVFFQVRPNSDALYKSELFPWSEVLSGKQGVAPDGGFDPLAYLIDKAHKTDIKVHAWINPYRIGDPSKLSDNNPAKLYPEYTVACSDGLCYYNPGLPQVRSLVLDGIGEILDNYAVDGIHFDDYFYPYDVDGFDDAEAFAHYGAGFDSIEDFRRESVNLLIKEAGELVHKKDKSLKFGVSPFGIWDNKRDNPLGSDTTGMSSYTEIFADSRYWVKNNLVDYICPQIYWSFENSTAPFDKVLDWWNKLCENSKTDLYVGIAYYKQGDSEKGWNTKDQISRQLAICEKKSAVDGVVFFSFSSVKNPPQITEGKPQKTEYTPTPAVTSALEITAPENGYKTSYPNCSFSGVADPSNKLTVNGREIPMTKHGYFAVYLPLEFGANTFEFKNADSVKQVKVIRQSPQSETDETVITDVYPYGKCMFYSGENVKLRLESSSNVTAFARVNGEDIRLEASSDENVYTASVLMPNLLSGDGTVTVEYYAEKDGKRYFAKEIVEITVACSPSQMYTLENCYVYDTAAGGSMMDNYQYPQGVRVSVTAQVGDMYRLDTGKWVYKNAVSAVKTESVTDVDSSKYLSADFSFKNDFSYQYDVSEEGILVIDFYHSPGDCPELKKQKGVSVKLVKKTRHTVAYVTLRGSPVTGFLFTGKNSSQLNLLLYNNAKDGLVSKTVVLDVGHGGSDPGALGPVGKKGAGESGLNLSLATMLKQKLEAEGATVYLTRTSDKTLPLDDRAGLMRSYSPDICISIHHNSVSLDMDFTKATGLLTLYSRETSAPLAKMISKKLNKSTGLENLGANTQSLNVCRDYRYPCVLLECGFVCNPAEYEKILTDEYKETLCSNITEAVKDYFD